MENILNENFFNFFFLKSHIDLFWWGGASTVRVFLTKNGGWGSKKIIMIQI